MLVATRKRGRLRKDEVVRSRGEIFGKGTGQAIAKAATVEIIVERIEELSRREEPLQEWENMRRETKRRLREDRTLNLFWRKNKTFPTQYGGDDETPDTDETLEFWRSVNNKEVSEGWKQDRDIRGVL